MLVVHTPAAQVEDTLAEKAIAWDIWESETHEQDPPDSGKFHFDYANNYEERVLIISGEATLTPDDKDIAPLTLRKGDFASFKRGFACNWHVTMPMKKHYAYFDEEGEQTEPISCDVCGENCWPESWFVQGKKGKDDQDICPSCYDAAKIKPRGAQHQRKGKTVPKEKKAPSKRKR